MTYDRTPPAVVTASQEKIKIFRALIHDERLDHRTQLEIAGAVGGFSALIEIYEELYHRFWEAEYERHS